ncbi:MAG: hypothetical protein MAG431_01394 [Chloroflexi bacterium]|nr:hypothetical protein [Chloroflexota bacterium]
MTVETLSTELSQMMALPESEVLQKGLLSLMQKEIRLAELDIANIRERYNVFSLEDLNKKIATGQIPGHPAWEDYIIWKNKKTHIDRLYQLTEKL